MKPLRNLALASLLASLLVPLAGQASPLKIDAARSSVGAVFKQMNVPVEAKFKQFTAVIDYDAKHPESARAQVTIATASLDIGDPEYNREVGKKEWFNTAQFPHASFVSTTIKPAADGTLAVTGKLTIKGKTADVAFPLTVRTAGTRQLFDGQIPIRRLTFGIGEGEWSDTSMLANEVIIKFRVAAGTQ
jgi:polyisoprenoid-binding protein YceI